MVGKTGRARRWLVGALLVLAVSATLWVAFVASSGRAAPPSASRDAAERALAAARAAEASRWAATPLAEAESAVRAALTECRRQELHPYPLRDFRSARRALQTAEAAAAAALSAAIAHRDSARDDAATALAAARCELEASESLSRSLSFKDDARALVGKATLHLREAEIFTDGRDFGSARLRADLAAAEARGARERMGIVLGRFVDPENVRNWRAWREETIAWSAKTGEAAIVVNKDEGSLTLFVGGRPHASYDVEFGTNRFERKLRAGDEATPEGRYRITAKRGPGETVYHRALELDYPNGEDRRRFEQQRHRGLLPPSASLGKWIEIHGAGGRGQDWTRGCVSLTDEDIDDLFDRVRTGTPVTIIGGDGDGGRFSGVAGSLGAGGGRDCRGG